MTPRSFCARIHGTFDYQIARNAAICHHCMARNLLTGVGWFLLGTKMEPKCVGEVVPEGCAMAFTFLHTADWQVGKTFGGFDPEKASLLRHARLSAIDRLAAAAAQVGARDIFVCGDIFDSAGLPDLMLRATLAKLANHPECVWHLLPGNHDPARPDGVWRRIATIGLPGNVRLLLKPEPVAIAAGVVVLPAPLLAKAVGSDPTAWMDAASTPPGAVRIGIAHGSTQGFGSSGLASVGIDPGRRKSARLDYLALGDWHGVREIARGVWYAGTPEPDQFPDNEPGFALAVTIDRAGAEPRVEAIPTGMYRWVKSCLSIAAIADLAPVEAEIGGAGAAKSNLLVELELRGTVSLATDAEITARLVSLEPSLFHLSVRREDLKLDAGGADIARLHDPQLVRVAEGLEGMRTSDTEGAIAEGALRRLFALSRQLEGQAS
jgi:DNA repair exonuclease SbcCD nuclease subunit